MLMTVGFVGWERMGMLERRGRLPGGLADGKVSGRMFELTLNIACPQNLGRAV